MSVIDGAIQQMSQELADAEAKLAARGIDTNRIQWTTTVQTQGDSVEIRATARLKTDFEMIGRCDNPSCCG